MSIPDDAPTPDEILAYVEDRLDTAERQLFEARLARHPDAARAAVDLAAFPDVQPAPGTTEPSDEEVLDAFRRFKERLSKSSQPNASERAQAAAELQAWPDIRPAPGVQEPADENVLTSLRGLKARIREHHLTRGVRSNSDDEPTPEEILAYVEGQLDAGQRQLFEARLARHPDAARAAADLKAVPDVEPAPGTTGPSDEDILDSLRQLMKRLSQDPPEGYN